MRSQRKLTDYTTTGPKPTDLTTMRDYTKIDIWKLADDPSMANYQATQSFPREENYGITSQTRRAPCFGSANIVEGSSRHSKAEYLHFL